MNNFEKFMKLYWLTGKQEYEQLSDKEKAIVIEKRQEEIQDIDEMDREIADTFSKIKTVN